MLYGSNFTYFLLIKVWKVEKITCMPELSSELPSHTCNLSVINKAITFLIPVDVRVRRLNVESPCDLIRVARIHIGWIHFFTHLTYSGWPLQITWGHLANPDLVPQVLSFLHNPRALTRADEDALPVHLLHKLPDDGLVFWNNSPKHCFQSTGNYVMWHMSEWGKIGKAVAIFLQLAVQEFTY